MRRLFPRLALAVVFGTILPSLASAEPILPSLTVCVNEECVDLSDRIPAREPDGPKILEFETALTLNGAELNIYGAYNEDPFIIFNFSALSLVPLPINITVLYTTPIVPGLYSEAGSLAVLDLEGGRSGATVENSAFPTYLSGFGLDGAVPSNLGVDLGTGDCVANPGPTTCDYGVALNTLAPTFFDALQARLAYVQTGEGSIVEWNGIVALEPAVPEPSLMALASIGLAGAYLRRRKVSPRA
jgi:hypothetical protein